MRCEYDRKLKAELDSWVSRVGAASFIESDPVQFPRRYSSREDREIAAFLAAAIAWGRRDLILKSAEKMFALMGPSPYAYVMSGFKKPGGRCIHRTFFEKDLYYFCRGFRYCYKKYGNLEKLFALPLAPSFAGESSGGMWNSIALFRNEMAKGSGGLYTKHIADPLAGSACKRINLALRWLVRNGDVDLGIWKSISPGSLFIPLDLHVGRVARSLGLLVRKSNDRKAVTELTEKLRLFCPEDPAKYDMALFNMGIAGV
jgi:uncharacterized protein (TIGR02757 family)